MWYRPRVIDDRGHQSHLRLNPDDARDLGIEHRRQLVLCYGNRAETMYVYTRPNIPRGELQVGHLAAAHLLLDTAPGYSLVVRGERLILGPVIGLMMRTTEEEMIRELDLILPYLHNHEQVGGLAFIFASEGVNYDTQEIVGYRYDPSAPSHLVRGTFPFPGAWFRRVGFLSTQDWRRCRQIMGRRMLNGYYFTKWEFWSWLGGIPEAAEHIAFSSELITVENLDAFLNRFGAVYIKPLMAHSGFGIEKVLRTDDGYIIDRNYLDTVTVPRREMAAWMEQYSSHILQQPIPIMRWQGRQVTYRAIIQRDRGGFWQLTGLVGFFGGTDCITGNWSRNGGFLKPGLESLKIQFEGDEKVAFRKLSEMRDVCTRLAYIMGVEVDAYLDFGMDVGIGEDGKIWVIEANKRQHYETCAHVGDHQLHLESMAQGLTSARHIALL